MSKFGSTTIKSNTWRLDDESLFPHKGYILLTVRLWEMEFLGFLLQADVFRWEKLLGFDRFFIKSRDFLAARLMMNDRF
jgi:hypothetical protein